MAYKPKKKRQLENQSRAAVNSNSGELSEPDIVETDVEAHPIEDEIPFSEKASQKLAGILNHVNDETEPLAADGKPKKKYYYNSYARKKEKERQSELGNLITSVLVIAVTAAPMNEGLKPNEDEIGSISTRIANILWRHNILTGKLSGDALDSIAIIAVLAEYWQRTKGEREHIRAIRAGSFEQSTYPYEQTGEAASIHASPIDPYLDRLASESEGGS